MEELLGLSDADFEGVEDEETVEEEENRPGEPSHISRSSNPPSEPDRSTHLANAKSTVEKPSETRVLSSRPLGSSSPRVDASPTLASTSLGNGIKTSTNSVGEHHEDKVDTERRYPLPEVVHAGDEALALLYRMERCAVEFRTAEIEEAIKGLSARPDGNGVPAGLSRGAVEAALSACRAALRLGRGEYEELLQETKLFSPPISTISVDNETGPMRRSSSDHGTAAAAGTARSLRSRVESFVVGSGDNPPQTGSIPAGRDADGSTGGVPTEKVDGSDASVWRAAEVMWSGAAALGLFFQENYTGPELEASRREGLDAWLSQKVGLEGCPAGDHGGELRAGSDVTLRAANLALACDGELVYPRSSLVTSLLMAREILASLATPSRASWRGVRGEDTASSGFIASEPHVANGGTGPVNERGQDSSADIFRVVTETLSSASWWSGRACVTHARLLLSGDRSETLWGEARGLFRRAVRSFGGGVEEGSRGVIGGAKEAVKRRVAGQVWLEWGLAQHHFQDPSKGKASFARAKEASGLTVRLTGALGKRTKHQQTQVAQLVLVASSAFIDGDPSSNGRSDQAPGAAGTESHGESGDHAPTVSSEALSGEHDGEGVGQLRPAENADGEGQPVRGERAEIARPELGMSTAIGEGETRAAARRVQHAKDSELLEDIGFVEAELQNPGKLQDIDLAIILGLCLDVSNSNPRDGLTNEEMTPYIARVLRQPGCNWMIYSTALLQRSWVEFERSHARDRAALQIQALLDQHTTKLTYTQSSTQSIENSAPVQDRVHYLSSLSFPPRWELKRDLAQRYASMGVLGSAAEAFVDLEMWEEVVSCYRQMEQVHKAERIARERLKEQETPPMWAALGDLTQDPECWERAWELSGRRYARAKASLGRLRFSERDYAAACSHFEDALAVKPLLTPAWFTLGVARMRLGWWSLALEAFSRVVQQEPEEGEGWGNMGAVHMHEGNWANATACFTEGLKQMPRNWRMWENQAEALLRLGRWSSAVYACHRMLDLADKSKRGVDVNYLALLVEGTLEQEPPGKAASSHPALDASVASESSPDDLADRPLSKQVAELLGRVASASSADARLWEVYARFNEGAGRDRSRVLDCLSKQCRALQNPGWEKDAAVIARLASANDKLVKLHLEDGRRQSVYQAKMHLSTAVGKIKAMEVCVGCPGHERLAALLHDVEGVLAELKKN